MKHPSLSVFCTLFSFGMMTLGVSAQDQSSKPPVPKGAETASQIANLAADMTELKKQVADLPEIKKTQDTILRMLQDAAQSQQKTVLQVQKNVSDLAALKDRLEALEGAINRAATGADGRPGTVDPTLRDRLNRLEEQISRLQADRLADTRRAFAQPSPSSAMPTTAGQIQINNLYWTPLTVLVDGVPYTLLPNETRYVTRQPGNFSYEVLGVQPSVIRTLTAGEMFTIRINR